MISPENTLAKNDPGDDVQKRFRYQAGYAALISLSLLDVPQEYEEIFCEHHEDTLIRKSGNKFIGVQVKTRESGREPFKSDDTQILNTIKRFVEHNINFPGYFEKFVIATDYSFWADNKNRTTNLYKMIEVAEEARQDSQIRMHRELKRYVKKICDMINSENSINITATEKDVLDVLCMIELQEDLPKFNDLELRIAKSIQDHYDIGNAEFSDLLSAAKDLINQIQEASSLTHISTKKAYFSLCDNPQQELVDEIITGKRISKTIVETILSKNLSSKTILKSIKDNPISELPKGMNILEFKMARGNISVENINMMKDQKYSTEYLLAQWLSKYNSKKAENQFTHIQSIVKNECLEAYDMLDIKSQPNGTKMLIEVRKRLRERYSNAANLFFDCQYEHLLGIAGILTEMCDIWWSEKFDIQGGE